jgi:uncharacterized protein (TIGR02145 family)
MTYTWKVGSSATVITATNTYSATNVAVGATTYSVTVRNSNGCSSLAATGTITVYAAPTISRISGTANQTVSQGTEISKNIFTASNATSISQSGSLPTGVSGTATANAATYTISGTPTTATATGTYSYTVIASNTNGCPSASISGTITVIAGTPQYAVSTKTWTVGTQTWSDVINIPSCNKSTYTATATTADCRNNGSYGYLYSWMYVKNNASTLCPSPWHVPTSAEFCTLDKALSNTSTCNNRVTSSAQAPYYGSAWGGTKGGYCHSNGSLDSQGLRGYFWTATESSSSSAYVGYIGTEHLYPQNTMSKNYGALVRCVK